MEEILKWAPTLGNSASFHQENHSNESIFCDVMKDQTFVCPHGHHTKLTEKLNDGLEKFEKIQRRLYCLLDNGRNEIFTIHEVVDELLQRNYPELNDFDGTQQLAIFVPEWYLTRSIKYVEPSRGRDLLSYSDQAMSLCPERKKYFEDLKKFYLGGQRTYRGELPERNLYIALQNYFNQRDEKVTIFHSLDILKMNLEKLTLNEKDFVIINATRRCIIVIEAKRALGPGNSITKSIQQLREAKQDFEEWFAAEGLENWTYLPMIYTESLEVALSCTRCKKLVIVGKY